MPLTHHDPSAFRWKDDFCTWYNHLEMIPMVKSGSVSYRNVIRCVIFRSDPSLRSLLWYRCDSALISSISVFLTEVFVFVQIKPMGLKPSSLGEGDEFRKQRLMMWEGMEISRENRISSRWKRASDVSVCKWEWARSGRQIALSFSLIPSEVLLCFIKSGLTSTGLFLLVPQRTLFFLRSRVLESIYNIWRYLCMLHLVCR